MWLEQERWTPIWQNTSQLIFVASQTDISDSHHHRKIPEEILVSLLNYRYIFYLIILILHRDTITWSKMYQRKDYKLTFQRHISMNKRIANNQESDKLDDDCGYYCSCVWCFSSMIRHFILRKEFKENTEKRFNTVWN